MSIKKAFEVLAIPENSSLADVKKAYHRLSLKHHPDKGGRPEVFVQIYTAFEIITNKIEEAADREKVIEMRDIANLLWKEGENDLKTALTDGIAVMKKVLVAIREAMPIHQEYKSKEQVASEKIKYYEASVRSLMEVEQNLASLQQNELEKKNLELISNTEKREYMSMKSKIQLVEDQAQEQKEKLLFDLIMLEEEKHNVIFKYPINKKIRTTKRRQVFYELKIRNAQKEKQELDRKLNGSDEREVKAISDRTTIQVEIRTQEDAQKSSQRTCSGCLSNRDDALEKLNSTLRDVQETKKYRTLLEMGRHNAQDKLKQAEAKIEKAKNDLREADKELRRVNEKWDKDENYQQDLLNEKMIAKGRRVLVEAHIQSLQNRLNNDTSILSEKDKELSHLEQSCQDTRASREKIERSCESTENELTNLRSLYTKNIDQAQNEGQDQIKKMYMDRKKEFDLFEQKLEWLNKSETEVTGCGCFII